MKTNALPKYDLSDNPTDCCPRFDPEPWEGQELHFSDKLFVKAKTRSIFHMPLNFGSVFAKTFKAIDKADAQNMDQFIVLSHDPTAWTGEHLFSVSKKVPHQEMVHMTGDFLTKVFEGSYSKIPKWEKEMEAFVKSKAKEAKKTYFYYTTCPKCAKYYGKNYIVAVTAIR